METIIFKARNGTKARLRRLNPNISALLREELERLLSGKVTGTAFEKADALCGSLSAPRKASMSQNYLKQYVKKGAH